MIGGLKGNSRKGCGSKMGERSRRHLALEPEGVGGFWSSCEVRQQEQVVVQDIFGAWFIFYCAYAIIIITACLGVKCSIDEVRQCCLHTSTSQLDEWKRHFTIVCFILIICMALSILPEKKYAILYDSWKSNRKAWLCYVLYMNNCCTYIQHVFCIIL
jgi:hypothetical protein